MHKLSEMRPKHVTPRPLSELLTGLNPQYEQSSNPSANPENRADVGNTDTKGNTDAGKADAGKSGSGSTVAAETMVKGASLDSNDLAPGEVFIALKGANAHAASYVAQAQQNGAVAVITDAEGAMLLADAKCPLPVAIIAEPRQNAGLIASRAYSDPYKQLKTVGVTGTNGKTTTSFALHSILEAAGLKTLLTSTALIKLGEYEAHSSRTTLEAPVLHRLLAFAVEQGCQAAVIEVSSHAMSLWRTSPIVFDTVGFTNLQHDHLDYYKTIENYFQAKQELLTAQHAKYAVICVDDEWGARAAQNCVLEHVTFSAYQPQAKADYVITRSALNEERVSFTFELQERDGQSVDLEMAVPGKVNLQNAALAYLLTVNGLGISPQAAAEGLREMRVPGRFEIISRRDKNLPLVIVDYAHTPESLVELLRLVRGFTPGNLTLVFGTDGDRDASKRLPLARLAAQNADKIWVTDENPRTENPILIRRELLEGIREIRPDLREVTEIETCRRDAVREAIFQAQIQDTVLLTGKGSEHYQEVMGVAHAYLEADVCREVLAVYPKRHMFKFHDLPLED